MMLRPRVLFLACHLPYPPVSGGRRRELELIRRLSRQHDIHLMVVSKTYDQDLANSHELERFCTSVEVFAADRVPRDADRQGEPLQVLRHRCDALSARVAEVLDEGSIDMVHVEGYYLMQHVPEQAGVPVMLVDQNIEYDLERQRSAAGGDAHDLRTHRAEVAAWRRADALGVLTTEDRDMLVAAFPGADVWLVPDGADHLPEPATGDQRLDHADGPLAVFLANFGYEPNVDAALHLCGDILPRVHARMPDVNLWLVGTDPPPAVAALAGERVRVTGRVPEVEPYIDAADVMVCPLRIGGGVKVKAIEALRRGKCVVATTVGAQGMPGPARSALAIADDPAEFADHVCTLLADDHLRHGVERRSARAGRLLPTWDDAGRALAAAWTDVLRERSALRSVS